MPNRDPIKNHQERMTCGNQQDWKEVQSCNFSQALSLAVIVWFSLVSVGAYLVLVHQTVAEKAFCLPESPEDGSKQKSHADGIEEAHAVVLRHTPVGRRVFGKHGVELNHKGFGVLGLERQGLSALLWTAELIQQLVILPAVSQIQLA